MISERGVLHPREIESDGNAVRMETFAVPYQLWFGNKRRLHEQFLQVASHALGNFARASLPVHACAHYLGLAESESRDLMFCLEGTDASRWEMKEMIYDAASRFVVHWRDTRTCLVILP